MMFYKSFNSPIGKITLVANQTHLLSLYVGNEDKPLLDEAKRDDKHSLLNSAQAQLEEYFSGKRKAFELPLAPTGTEFQNKAWKALTKIPYGKVWSYGKQAEYLKSPNAQRAVGGANGKNPIPVIIPCHRVIGSTGKLTGFSGGMDIKVFLLKLEGHQVDPEGLRIIEA